MNVESRGSSERPIYVPFTSCVLWLLTNFTIIATLFRSLQTKYLPKKHIMKDFKT